MKNELLEKYKKIKYLKLISAMIIDFIGSSSFFIPVVGESVDWVWGPISGVLIYLLFPNHKKIAIFGGVEELIPFTDFIPTACMAWSSDYVFNNKKHYRNF